MSDETVDPAAARAALVTELRFARTDWLTLCGDVSLKVLEAGIAIGHAIGDVSWDEAVVAFKVQTVALIETRMADRPPIDVPARQAALAHLHETREHPNCVCQTPSCGHLATDHVGPNGACVICEKECWS